MEWEFIVALIVAIPVVLVPVAFVWYLSIGGIHRAVKEARKGKVTHEEGAEAVAQERPAERELVGARH